MSPFTQSQKKLINSLVNLVKLHESLSLLSMPGLGKNKLIEEIVRQINSNDFGYEDVITSFVTTEEALERSLEKTRKLDKSRNILHVITITEGVLVSGAVAELLNSEYINRHGKLTTVVAMTPGRVFSLPNSNLKVFSKNRFIVEFPGGSDAKSILNFHLGKFDFILNEEQKQSILALTAGHPGLMKYIVAAFSKNPTMKFDVESLLGEPTVLMWLSKIYQDFSVEAWKCMLSGSLDYDMQVLIQRCGYILENGEIKIPLLSKYIEKNIKPESAELAGELDLSFRELNLLNNFIKLRSKVVTRDDVSKIVWGENWIDEYSEAALSQVIFNIRQEIKAKNLPYNLKTVKGKGFVLL